MGTIEFTCGVQRSSQALFGSSKHIKPLSKHLHGVQVKRDYLSREVALQIELFAFGTLSMEKSCFICRPNPKSAHWFFRKLQMSWLVLMAIQKMPFVFGI